MGIFEPVEAVAATLGDYSCATVGAVMQLGSMHASALETLAAAMAATATLKSRIWMRFFMSVSFLLVAWLPRHFAGQAVSFHGLQALWLARSFYSTGSPMKCYKKPSPPRPNMRPGFDFSPHQSQ